MDNMTRLAKITSENYERALNNVLLGMLGAEKFIIVKDLSLSCNKWRKDKVLKFLENEGITFKSFLRHTHFGINELLILKHGTPKIRIYITVQDNKVSVITKECKGQKL